MKYNKYCSNKYSSKYNMDDKSFISNNDSEICNISAEDYNYQNEEQMKIKSQKKDEAITIYSPEEENSCQPNYECNNCIQPCKCCNGVECNFDRGKVESIRTLVKRLFTSEKAETCPAIEEITEVEGSTDMEINLDLIPNNCNCECPAIDATSRFTVKCVEVESTNVTLGNPEIKLNGKIIPVTENPITSCYDGIITKEMLRCSDSCKAEKGELCARVEDWTFEGMITIKGCVVTAGQGCEFALTMTTLTPIEFSDNTVFYMGDICVVDGDLKLCFNPRFCFLVDSIVSDGQDLTVKGSFKMNVESNVNIFKDQEVCIQAVVVE